MEEHTIQEMRQNCKGTVHRLRINTEERAKVVAAVWGLEFVQFLAALAILHYRKILKNGMNSSIE